MLINFWRNGTQSKIYQQNEFIEFFRIYLLGELHKPTENGLIGAGMNGH